MNRYPTDPNALADGMTKREFFAAAALQGLLAREPAYVHRGAARAVQYADALIKALNEGQPQASPNLIDDDRR